ncbi:hypothetical protein NL676_037989 [Syzygium grande]|nr:hypothetical protein NL676_037989 [Syzygium grande]
MVTWMPAGGRFPPFLPEKIFSSRNIPPCHVVLTQHRRGLLPPTLALPLPNNYRTATPHDTASAAPGTE